MRLWIAAVLIAAAAIELNDPGDFAGSALFHILYIRIAGLPSLGHLLLIPCVMVALLPAIALAFWRDRVIRRCAMSEKDLTPCPNKT